MTASSPPLAEPKKFLFDQVFEADGTVTSLAERSAFRFTEEDLAAARAEGRREGLADAQAKAQAALAASIDECARAAASLSAALTLETRTLRVEARELALAIARRACGVALAAYGEQRIIAAFDAALEDLASEPRIVVRVPAQGLDAVRERLHSVADSHGFGGALVVRAQEGAGPGDVVIDWGDGARAIETADVFSRLEEALRAADLACAAAVEGSEP